VRRLILTLTLASALLTAASPASARVIKAIWGPSDLSNGQSAGPVYKDLGVEEVQMFLNWDSVAPTKPANPRNPNDPAYQWGPFVDAAIATGKAYGFRVDLQIQRSPAWANGGHPGQWAPTNPKDFADFAYAAAKRFPSVHRWLIWGEPSRAPNWQPLPSNKPIAPRRYAKLLDATYGQLKSVSKRNVVVGGMTFTVGDVKPKDWVRWMRLPNGKPPRLDIWGHNPFSTRIPNLSKDSLGPKLYDYSDIDDLHRDVHEVYGHAYPSRFARSGPKIWVTEFTIQTDHGSQDFNFFVSKANQGQWLTAAYQQANKTNYIAGVGWLGLLDEPVAPYNRTTGLLTYELARKPAYYAYKRAK
jgi:hypothetical protein